MSLHNSSASGPVPEKRKAEDASAQNAGDSKRQKLAAYKRAALENLYPDGVPADIQTANGLPIEPTKRKADRYPAAGRGKKQEYTDYAYLSKSAYENGNNPDNIPAAFKKDAELSNRNRTVFYNVSTKEAVVAYRGTNPSNLKDLGTDLAIAVGAQAKTSRFKNAEKVAEQAIAKYGKDNVTLTGHSLGGSQALHVGAKYDLRVRAFNPGKGFDGLRAVEGLTGSKGKSKATIYATGLDPISVNSLFGKEKVKLVKPRSVNPLGVHDISNFF